MHAVWNRIMESGKFLLVESGICEIFLVESGILGFGIWNTPQGILINLRIESSTFKESGIQYQESRIQNPWRGIQNARLSWIPLYGC